MTLFPGSDPFRIVVFGPSRQRSEDGVDCLFREWRGARKLLSEVAIPVKVRFEQLTCSPGAGLIDSPIVSVLGKIFIITVRKIIANA